MKWRDYYNCSDKYIRIKERYLMGNPIKESDFSRSTMLLGQEAMDKIADSRVAVFGIGGVGGYVAEALIRTGLGQIDIIDSDTVSLSNINRQIIANQKTIGRNKVDVMKERILDINPNAIVRSYNTFFLPENSKDFDFSKYDYVVDAVDTVTAKLEIISKAKEANVPIISCMGAGCKLDPTRLEVGDIYETSVCPLAKVMRKLLRERGIKDLKVVYSKEKPIKSQEDRSMALEDKIEDKIEDGTEGSREGKTTRKRSIPGSVSFVPSVAGLIIASEIIMDLAQSS